MQTTHKHLLAGSFIAIALIFSLLPEAFGLPGKSVLPVHSAQISASSNLPTDTAKETSCLSDTLSSGLSLLSEQEAATANKSVQGSAGGDLSNPGSGLLILIGSSLAGLGFALRRFGKNK